MLQKLKDSWWIFSGILIPVAPFAIKFYIQAHDLAIALAATQQDLREVQTSVSALRAQHTDLERKFPLLQYQVNTISTKVNVLIPSYYQPAPAPQPADSPEAMRQQ